MDSKIDPPLPTQTSAKAIDVHAVLKSATTEAMILVNVLSRLERGFYIVGDARRLVICLSMMRGASRELEVALLPKNPAALNSRPSQ